MIHLSPTFVVHVNVFFKIQWSTNLEITNIELNDLQIKKKLFLW